MKPRFGINMKGLNKEDLNNCIIELEDGVLLSVEVKPGSKVSGIGGYDHWRKCLEIRVKAQAEKHKANRELILILASFLSLPPENITISRGTTSRKKVINIKGTTKEEIIYRLT